MNNNDLIQPVTRNLANGNEHCTEGENAKITISTAEKAINSEIKRLQKEDSLEIIDRTNTANREQGWKLD